MRRHVTMIVFAVLALGVVALIRAQGGPLVRHPIVTIRLLRAEAPAKVLVPVRGVERVRLRDTWGASRSGGRTHQGIDIFAPRGREVIAATRGIVVTVGDNALGGRIVRIFGPAGHWHYYAHLHRFAGVRPGDVVEAGTVLGYVGTTGNALGTPPHLHYGIYRFQGGAMNPYPFLR